MMLLINPPIEDYAVSGFPRQDKSALLQSLQKAAYSTGEGMAKETDPVSKYLAEIGRRGGDARVPKGAATFTAAERKAFARKGAAARWSKKPKTKKKSP
jgi:hypothetical protein